MYGPFIRASNDLENLEEYECSLLDMRGYIHNTKSCLKYSFL